MLPTPYGPAEFRKSGPHWQWTLPGLAIAWHGRFPTLNEALDELNACVDLEHQRRRTAREPLCPLLVDQANAECGMRNAELKPGVTVKVYALGPALAEALGAAIGERAAVRPGGSPPCHPSPVTRHVSAVAPCHPSPVTRHPLAVTLTAVAGDVLTGVVDSLDLLGETGLQRGDTIRFARTNVAEVL